MVRDEVVVTSPAPVLSAHGDVIHLPERPAGSSHAGTRLRPPHTLKEACSFVSAQRRRVDSSGRRLGTAGLT